MDSKYGHIDIWRNIRNLQAMSLCCPTGGANVCRLGTHEKGDWDERTFMTSDSPLQKFARWQHLEDWIFTAQTTELWQHYFNDSVL